MRPDARLLLSRPVCSSSWYDEGRRIEARSSRQLILILEKFPLPMRVYIFMADRFVKDKKNNSKSETTMTDPRKKMFT
jgi:hypothetical protein